MPPTRRATALERLRLDLATDHALTLQQVHRRYRLSGADLERERFSLSLRYLKPTHTSQRLTRVTFVALDAAALEQSDAALRHLAGTAAVRDRLGVEREAWDSSAWREAATMIPDAVWKDGEGRTTAIEYDTGSYNRTRVRDKAAAFANFNGSQVWGCPTHGRATHVAKLVQPIDPRAQILVATPF